jgi:hypothetical protein
MSPIAGFIDDDNKVFCYEEGEMDVCMVKREGEREQRLVMCPFFWLKTTIT